MNKKLCYIYLGYFTGFGDNILMCIGEEVTAVEYYLTKVRSLFTEQYEIRSVILDWESTLDLYEDYILYEYGFVKIKYLTARDINMLNSEIEEYVKSIERTYNSLKDYRNMIIENSKLKSAASNIDNTIYELKLQLVSPKKLRSLYKVIIKKSVVLSRNIRDYLDYIGYIKEDKELVNLFYKSILKE